MFPHIPLQHLRPFRQLLSFWQWSMGLSILHWPVTTGHFPGLILTDFDGFTGSKHLMPQVSRQHFFLFGHCQSFWHSGGSYTRHIAGRMKGQDPRLVFPGRGFKDSDSSSPAPFTAQDVRNPEANITRKMKQDCKGEKLSQQLPHEG